MNSFLKQSIQNNKGQVVLEYILITFVLVGFTFAVKQILVSSGVVPDLIKAPWAKMAGMIESGVWEEAPRARTQHPGHFNRHLSFKGDGE